jgi:DNA-directed RNA polymerase subunit RPC12/RpoP
MAQQLLEYRCPACGASLHFDSASQQVVCPYCDSSFSPQSLIDYDSFLKQDAQNAQSDPWSKDPNRWEKDEVTGLNVYTCAACGGEVLGDDTLASSRCPFCDNTVIMKRQFTGDWKPDLVLPFKLDKKTAQAAFRKHLHGKTLLPKAFRSESCIEEIKGMYVPFWLFSSDVSASMKYKASLTRSWADSRFLYHEISDYALLRTGDATFSRIPVDGSKKMSDALMDSLEPFNLSEAVPFQTAYLSGYFSDRYDVSADDSIPRAQKRFQDTFGRMMSQTTGKFGSVSLESANYAERNNKREYALLPVWLLHVRWKGKLYTFAMNGQTGKFVGNLPLDRGRARLYWLLFGGLFAILLGGSLLLAHFLGCGGGCI